MVKAVALAWTMAAALGAAPRGPAREVTLTDLTLPAERLPRGCALSPATAARAVLAPSVSPIIENPWVGTDAAVRALIRERIEGSVMTPDPPALTRKELAAFRLHLADGVGEAYAAVYTQAEHELTIVYGIKFADAEQATDSGTGDWTSRHPRTIRVTIGSIVAVVSGDGPCFQAVAAHVKSLAN